MLPDRAVAGEFSKSRRRTESLLLGAGVLKNAPGTGRNGVGAAIALSARGSQLELVLLRQPLFNQRLLQGDGQAQVGFWSKRPTARQKAG